MQPDTIIPDLSNPQSWNRFSYVVGNPIRYNDPSGHMIADDKDGGVASLACPQQDLACQLDKSERYKRHKERQRQDKLARLIFSGSGPNGSWTYEDGYRYFRNRDVFWGKPEKWDPNGPRGWELFALHADRLAANYSPNQRDGFIRDFALVFGGVSSRGDFTSAALGAIGGPKLPFLTYGNEGLPREYEDGLIFDDNQTHHYAGIFALGYFQGELPANAGNWVRDSWLTGGIDEINPGDLALGEVAARHGGSFASTNTVNIGQYISSIIR